MRNLLMLALLVSAGVGCKKRVGDAPPASIKDAGAVTGPTATRDASTAGTDPNPAQGSDMGSGQPTAVAPTVVVTLADAKGGDVGQATLSAVSGGVKIVLDLKGLPPGEHAIHVHETPTCTAPDFKSAGGHWNPAGKHHGMQNPEGPHAGDLPNFTVAADGTSKATLVATGMTWDHGPAAIWGPGGTALVIHATADDMKTDPAGNAGERIACGRISVP